MQILFRGDSIRGYVARKVNTVSRRTWITAGFSLLVSSCARTAPARPWRMVTRGPRFHWRGYYDKLLFSADDRYLLAHETEFQGREPRPDDAVRVGMIDLHHGDRWSDLGASRAWSWQQGSMLQWRPGSDREIVWNDFDGRRLVMRILDVKSRALRTLPHPFTTLAPDGAWALCSDLSSTSRQQPGYGWAPPGNPPEGDDGTGVYRMDLATGERGRLFGHDDLRVLDPTPNAMPEARHRHGHLLCNPSGTRIAVLHRYEVTPDRFRTHVITMDPRGRDVRIVHRLGVTHFCWRDDTTLLAYARSPTRGWGFHTLVDMPDSPVTAVGKRMPDLDGHCTYLPDRRWIVCDTYPARDGRQTVYLYDTASDRRIDIATFRQPPGWWEGTRFHEFRIDLHPCASRRGRLVCFDIGEPDGRQVCMADIAALTAPA
jgi:hypothetical protein